MLVQVTRQRRASQFGYPWPHEDPAQLHDGVMARTLSLRLGENPRLAGLKHCNRLEQILARTELAADAALAGGAAVQQLRQPGFRNHEQCVPGARVVPADTAHRSMWRGQESCGGLCCGKRVASVFRPGECELRTESLQAADEVFLTNARIGIWPLRGTRRPRPDTGSGYAAPAVGCCSRYSMSLVDA